MVVSASDQALCQPERGKTEEGARWSPSSTIAFVLGPQWESLCFPRLDPEGFPNWLLGDGVLLPTELGTTVVVFEMRSAKHFYVRRAS